MLQKPTSKLRIPSKKNDNDVEGEITPEHFTVLPSMGPFERINNKTMPMDWRTWLFAPFDKASTNPGLFSTILVVIMMFLAALVNGWVIYANLNRGALDGATNFERSVVSALVQAGLFIGIGLWTYERYLPVFLYPEIEIFTIVTGTLGIVPAIIKAGFMLFGYAMAGLILRALYGDAQNLVANTAIDAVSYWLYSFGVFVILLTWMYTSEFYQRSEVEMHSELGAMRKKNKRAIVCTAIIIGALILAFFSHGIHTFTMGPTLTGHVFRNNFAEGAVYPDSPASYFVWYIAPLIIVVIVALLYLFGFGILTGCRLKYEAGKMTEPLQSEVSYSNNNEPVKRKVIYSY